MLNLINKLPKSLLDQGICSGSSFFLQITLAYTLDLSIYGWYVFIWMLVMAATSIQQAFIISSLQSLFPQLNDVEKEIIKKGLPILQILLVFLLSILIALFWLAYGSFNPEAPVDQTILYLPYLCLGFLQFDYLRKQDYIFGNGSESWKISVAYYMPLFLVIAGLYWFNLLTLSTVFIAQGLIGLLVVAAYYLKSKARISVHLDSIKETFKAFWSYSYWLCYTAILQWFSSNSFLIAAATLIDATTLGGIRLVQSIMGLVQVFLLALENKIPSIAAEKYFKKGKIGLSNFLKEVALKSWALSSIVLTAIVIGFQLLKYTNFSFELPGGIILVSGFAFISFMAFFSFPFRIALRTYKLNKAFFIAYTVSASISFFAAYPVVNSWGIYGVLVGLIGLQFVQIIIFFLFLINFPESNYSILKAQKTTI